MTPPRVSILTPTFNHRDYIDRCIESVLAQSYPYWDMVVIDDASTDETADIVAWHADHEPRLRLRRHVTNAGRYGIATAFNEGLAHSTGRYLAILEGDDYWPPDKLETQVSLLESRPDAALCHGRVAIVRGGKVAVPTYPWPRRIRENRPVGSALRALLPGENPIAACTTVIRREALEKIGGFQPRAASERPDPAGPDHAAVPVGLTDYPTWMDLAMTGPFLFVPKVMGYWRRHAFSVIHRHQETLWTEKLAYTRYFLESRGEALESLPVNLRRSRGRAGCLAHLELCRLHLLAERRREAAAEFGRAWAARNWFLRSPRRNVRLLALGLSCHGPDVYRPLLRLIRRRPID